MDAGRYYNTGAGAELRRTFFNLESHNVVSLEIELVKIDNWNGHRFFVDVDGARLFQSDALYKKKTGTSNTCGDSNGYDWVVRARINLEHTASTLSLRIYTNLENGAYDQSFGMKSFTLELETIPALFAPPPPPASVVTLNGVQVYEFSGWMLIFNVAHNAGTPNAVRRDTAPSGPSDSAFIWLSGLGVTSAEDVLAVRFFCQTGQHPRVVDFASFNALQREAVLTGNYSGSPLADVSVVPPLGDRWYRNMSDHTAFLPTGATHTYNSSASGHDFGFNFPFWQGTAIAQTSKRAWTVAQSENDDTNAYACDSPIIGDTYDTLHQMWVRLSPPPRASCLEHFQNGETLSGVYRVTTSNINVTRRVYCDMDTDGGGWTLVVKISGGSRKHTLATAVSNASYIDPRNTTVAKLDDEAINAILTDKYRFKCSTCVLFFEPIAFAANDDRYCKDPHGFGESATSSYSRTGSCEPYGFRDTGLSSWPNATTSCGGYIQYNNDGGLGCYHSRDGHAQFGELWVR